MWTILSTLETTAVGTVVGLAVEYLKNLGPGLIYSATETIPVRVPGKSSVGAYELRVRNNSRKKAEDITLHLQAGGTTLRVEDYSAPAGLKLASEPDNNGIKIPLTYLKPGETLRLRIVAEGSYIPHSLQVGVSSPNKIAAKPVNDIEKVGTHFRFAIFGMAIMLIFLAGRASYLLEDPTQQTFEPNRRQTMVSAASDAGLPNLTSAILASSDPSYYEAGDLAFSFAASSTKAEDIPKYRRFVSLTLGTAVQMAPESQANLFYSLGKIDLLLSDASSAANDFKIGIAKSKPTIESRLRSDPKIREILTKMGLA